MNLIHSKKSNGITLPLSVEFTLIPIGRWNRNIGRYYRLADTSVCPFLCTRAWYKVYLYILTLDHKTPTTPQPSPTGVRGQRHLLTPPPPCSSPGGAARLHLLPHQGHLPEELQRQPSLLPWVRPGPHQGQPRLPEDHLPLPLSAAAAQLLSKVPPPAELQWYVPLLVRLLVLQPQALLQGQER